MGTYNLTALSATVPVVTPSDASFVTVASAGATFVISAPKPKAGREVWFHADGAFTLETTDGSDETINTEDADGSKDVTVAAGVTVRLKGLSDTEWLGTNFAAIGTESAANPA